ncbi:conserved hypothetical protein [Coccidioides posadasii str. Silveira]|uniref:Uncharacterized protein n=1 Tax=Coccidioides posadasii (strain RMSCC 757 / Silveira) TaxID=443226 RepID=E9D7Y5_COCPS|nr:conserved hypothetical protein [Coccidioides posadasii str. Silveira]
MEDWQYGSFNVCIPVTINNWKKKRARDSRYAETSFAVSLSTLKIDHASNDGFRSYDFDCYHGSIVQILLDTSHQDLDQSNIFVDGSCNLTCLIDLEWVCTRPIQMIRKPPWLTSKTVDEIAEDAEVYGEVHAEFMYIMLGEDEKMSAIASHNRVAQHMVSFCTIHNPQLQ